MPDKIEIRVSGGDVLEVEAGSTAKEVLSEVLSKKKKKALVLARIDGELKDLNTILSEPATIEPVFKDAPESLETLRHTTAHVLAQAVKELFPGVKLGIGPAISTGFYYDFDYERPFTPEDLDRISVRMSEIIKEALPIQREDIPLDIARDRLEKAGETYKLELLDRIAEEGDTVVSIYSQGDFFDLCRGPHLEATSDIPAFNLLHTAGAYWLGDESRPMLQRIYGTAFFSKKELKAYLARLEEAKKRDHRRIGKDLELFSISEDIGPGLILWHPKGALVRKLIEDFWRDEHLRRGYSLLFTPHIAKRDLWATSGHLDFYSENMYSPMDIDEVSYQLKPMNCPFHIAIYNSKRRSYRELPMRWCELGTVYRYERTGTLHGLMRVRGFTQDDAHLFCSPDQLSSEIEEVLDMTLYVLRVFGFDRYDIYLSTKPEKYVGTEENWQRATKALEDALASQGLDYEIDPGEGVFYGPKIDIKIKDCLDRSWQCSTIQVDFNLPERFDMKYTGEDGSYHTPIMVHRALLGSFERFFGVLIEHYAGAFPLWLAPIQAIVLTVTDRQNDWAREIERRLSSLGIRVDTDLRNEKLGKKIREAQLQKIPYMLVVGDREAEDHTVSPRTRTGKTLDAMDLDSFAKIVEDECKAPFSQAGALSNIV